MPTAHRLACFRDDVVFLIYLCQRYLYPVDKTRPNEYGESFAEELVKERVSGGKKQLSLQKTKSVSEKKQN